MFERYTERARRVLFFARYETSQFGSPSIESEHMLLGLIREGKGVANQILDRSHLPLESIRNEIERRAVVRRKVPTSVEIPFSDEVKRSLFFASEESDLLNDHYIGTEHLLLGLLREQTSVAGTILASHGLELGAVRREIAALRRESESGAH
jgi:ATP-dependent Clp protease ATP-binding subunit ClpC